MSSVHNSNDDGVPLLKKYLVHAGFVSLMGLAAWQVDESAATDRNSLLYSIVAGEEVIEGPLDPTAYAGTDTPGVGGARLAALDANLGIDLITFEDPEANFASTLGGNAVVAPAMPVVPEPGSDTSTTQPKKAFVYTVQADDTIDGIAAQFNVSTNTILWANGLSSTTALKVGDHLTILPITGVLHTVDAGDTISGLAAKYDADAAEIISFNQIGDGSKLSLGQKIIIPDGYIAPRKAPAILPPDSKVALEPDANVPPASDAAGAGFVWPTSTRHIAQYFRWGHTGIDIDNRSRPAIYAADAGTVNYTGYLGGYGNLITIDHGNGLSTYYAHLDKFYVTPGETVTKGEAIGQMGSTGRSTGPHVHFEVRKGGQPVNPLGMY
ncbi:MAG TPA: M23 family metallopeptidase [Candidatus Andersenbacteria bacterium]|nr:M23 family metallopeptidase [Candidatus Andersenbacteria bacterium]